MSKYFRTLSIQLGMEDYEELEALVLRIDSNKNKFVKRLVQQALKEAREKEKDEVQK